ncbi:hypothetical protein NPIL_455341, partial [Nephila pilipes]
KGPNAPSDDALCLVFMIPYTTEKDSSRASKFGKSSSLGRTERYCTTKDH